MQRREFIAFLGVATAWPLAASAQSKIVRIGFIGNSTAALEANLVDAFRESLRDLRQLALLLVRKLSLRKREAQACSVPNDGYVRPSTVGLFRC